MKKFDVVAYISFAIGMGILGYALYENFSDEYQMHRKGPKQEQYFYQGDISDFLRE